METLEPSSRLIANHLKLLDSQLKDIKKEGTLSLKKQKIRAFKAELDSLRSELNMFELELCNATEKQRETHFVSFNNYEGQAGQLEKELRTVEDELNRRPDRDVVLFDQATLNRNEEPEVHNLDREQLQAHVREKLQEGNEDLDEMIRELSQGKNIMQEVNEEVRLQTERLSKAREDIQETYSLTKRSKKLVTYFKRQIMTDKIICVFAILIICAIIVIIVMKAVGFKNDSFNSNVIPNTNSSINMTRSG
jgi:hypothetical protein